ncbi:hypothetical protein BN903_70 [Halorubrum sp. AJ67]|nr:hypothetical protein BN903_70 [Halorubrum sp. AJ67]
MTTTANKIGVHCSCGISFSVNVEEQTVDDWWERKESRSYVETRKSVVCVCLLHAVKLSEQLNRQKRAGPVHVRSTFHSST